MGTPYGNTPSYAPLIGSYFEYMRFAFAKLQLKPPLYGGGFFVPKTQSNSKA